MSSTSRLFILLISCLLTDYLLSFKGTTNLRMRNAQKLKLQLRMSPSTVETVESTLKLVSFNILAPCYKRLKGPNGEKLLESDFPEQFLDRNNRICDNLLATDADVICLQEYWMASPELQQLYIDRLCACSPAEGGGEVKPLYSLHMLPRTSHWRSRDDGVAVLVRADRVAVEDERPILFHDCGDRVALMLLLALKPPVHKPDAPPQRFICVNTHLLFPHNEYSSNIRLREMTKILGYVEGYRQRDLCTTVCSRADVRLPVIIAGDFNGSPRGKVYGFARSQNYQAAMEEHRRRLTLAAQTSNPVPESPTATTETKVTATSTTLQETADQTLTLSTPVTTTATVRPPTGGEGKGGTERESTLGTVGTHEWVSHRSHRGTDMAVDHVFFQNPSEQVESKLSDLPDWTNLVYKEVKQRIIDTYGGWSVREVFGTFDQDLSNYVSRQEFESALERLGFMGEGCPALTPAEIDILVQSADKDDNGQIDYKEFYDRFWLATEAEDLEPTSETSNPPTETTPSKSKRNNMGSKMFSSRFAYARSQWLSDRQTDPAARTPVISVPPDAVRQANLLPDAKPMGDLRVRTVKLSPSALEQGVWPSDYLISDHGMVEVTFTAETTM